MKMMARIHIKACNETKPQNPSHPRQHTHFSNLQPLRVSSKSRDGFRVRHLREARGGGRAPPYAGSAGFDRGEGASEWSEGCGGSVRGDLHLRGSGSSEDEVHEVPPKEDEH